MSRPRVRRAQPRAGTVLPALDVRLESRRTPLGWLLGPLLLVVVLIAELTLLRERIGRDVDLLQQTARPAPVSDPSGGVPAPPVPVLAPPATAGIADVDLRAMGRCEPGAPCQVRVLIRPALAAPMEVRWTFRVLDRCTGAGWDAPGGTARVTAGGTGVAAVSTVVLPSAKALAVVALAGEPGTPVAASAPLRVPNPGTC